MNQEIYLLGLNHRTAGVEVREKYALDREEDFEKNLTGLEPVSEALRLSTCNRVEIVAVAEAGQGAADAILQTWAKARGGTFDELSPHVYSHRGHEAISHLFQVASSLDSMVLGEPQILGQLKDAYRRAVEMRTVGAIVNRLLHKSFFVAKRVRTETAVASSAVSISYAAVELAKRIFGDLAGQTAMLVGAGEMAELAATHLRAAGVSDILIANRTYSRAVELAKTLNGEPIVFDELMNALSRVDIVISSTGAPHTVLQARDIKQVMKKRRYKPMFFIDIAVPRDIDPDVNNIDNSYLYDIDDLKEVVEENLAQRQEEANKARAIIETEAETFKGWLKSLDLNPTIIGLLDRGEDIARQELAKTLKRLGHVDEETSQALECLVLSISKKIMHEPISFLKRRTQEEGSAARFVDQVRRTFNLDNEVIPENAHQDRKRGIHQGAGAERSLDCPDHEE